MLRSLAVPPPLLMLLLMMTTSLTIDARTIKMKISTTPEVIEETTYMHMPDGTITVDIEPDDILTTSPESETFSEPSPWELTEEPLPDSVIRPQGKEQAQEEQAKEERAREEPTRNPIDSEKETEITTEETTTEKRSSKKGYRFGATTSMPVGFKGFYTQKMEYMPTESIEDTTQYVDYTTKRNYFKRPARPARLDLEMAENRIETTTDAPALQNGNQDYFTTPVVIMTTDPAKSVPTQSPLFRFFTTSTVKPLFMEQQPETTTMWPESKKGEATTLTVLRDSTEVSLSSSTQVTDSTTEPAETTTIPASSSSATTGPEPLTARMELYLNIQYPVSEYPETTIATTSAPEITTVPETTILSISDPETTTSTTRAPETTTSTTRAPETTSSTTSAPEPIPLTTSAPETTTSTASVPETTTSTTSAPETSSAPETTTSSTSAPETSCAPETTTSTTSAPETTTSTTSTPLATTPFTKAPETTTTTPRPILTRAPRVERIFNSDGVEVLYGYSSVVRTNRS